MGYQSNKCKGKFNFIFGKSMIEITYKRQGNQKDSWVVITDEELFMNNGESKFMLYEHPSEYFRTKILDSILKKYNYTSLEEVLVWANDEKYGEEATSILNWYKTIYKTTEEQILNNNKQDTSVDFVENVLQVSKEELFTQIDSIGN